ncbi:SDR family NAD(P)-dependent oxidoreductase [Vibrio coralliilyticus]|uniref:SDR family NAD(P)-dependent oxidoreductase n=1 Tax=Vibrio coralliilyticus TaxID=190893 RepID=UPI000BAADB10|nr:SDR family oxidoreductase [Vibrio coralliilyticus]NOI57464.1 SDR family oxidoreductase [Vibrio coralliilyticus]PAT67914.1 glucose dehydrogenase [Vibrio coralliilyticus]
MKLTGKKAFITGATSGIGLAIARRFFEEGATIAINGRNAEKLETINREYFSNKALEVVADISKVEDIASAYELLKREFSELDVLVVNAGAYQLKPFTETTEQDFDDMFALNVKGAFFTMQYSAPLLSEGASVISISSVGAIHASWNQAPYNASKAAISSLTKSFACGLTHKKIRANTISPGVTETEIWDKVDYRDQVDQVAKNGIPLGRKGAVEEIAGAALFLASDDSAFMTTSDLMMDGGVTYISDPEDWGHKQ